MIGRWYIWSRSWEQLASAENKVEFGLDFRRKRALSLTVEWR
jgi:hypothetical protein